MTTPITRPKVADLVFRVFDRPLHPELFTTLAARRVERDGWVLSVRVTPAGHVLDWSRGAARVVEVVAAAGDPLPDVGRRLAGRVRAGHRGRCEVGPGVRYEGGVQVEVLAPEVFAPVHDELVADAAKRGVVFHFRPHHRLGLSPLGLVTAEAHPGGLTVHAFHTFPDEFTVVKTQTLIEPGR